MTTTFRTVTVPAYAHFPSETLHEGRYGSLTSGLCRTPYEARTRIAAIISGRGAATQAPDYQANEREMTAAMAKFDMMAIRDGGQCQRAIEAAIKAGIHTVEWAIASRYLVAGWV